jgi:hypothetical protein
MPFLWRHYARMPLHTRHDPALPRQDQRAVLDRIDIHLEVPAVPYKAVCAKVRPYGSVRGTFGNGRPYRD